MVANISPTIFCNYASDCSGINLISSLHPTAFAYLRSNKWQ